MLTLCDALAAPITDRRSTLIQPKLARPGARCYFVACVGWRSGTFRELGAMAKILIRNVLIGFGVGLVLMVGLTFVTAEKPEQSATSARH